jgi:hypothetical protein
VVRDAKRFWSTAKKLHEFVPRTKEYFLSLRQKWIVGSIKLSRKDVQRFPWGLTQLLPGKGAGLDGPVIHNARHPERMIAHSLAKSMHFLLVISDAFWMKSFAIIQGPQRGSQDARFVISPGKHHCHAHASRKQETESKNKTDRFINIVRVNYFDA